MEPFTPEGMMVDISFVAEAHEDTPDNKVMSLAVAKQIHKIIERTKFKKKLRSAIRNAAVDGDACLFVRFDPNIDTGKTYSGDIVCDIVENMNVMFGNPYNPEAMRLLKKKTLNLLNSKCK